MGQIDDITSARILEMKANGYSYEDIGREFGMKRKAVYQHIRTKTLTKERRDEINAARRQLRADKRSAKTFISKDGVGTAANRRRTTATFVPIEVIEDRDRSLMRQFSLEVDILGSPPPGRSALDRRMQHAR